jgi:AAA15 family ATPase/GTPase
VDHYRKKEENVLFQHQDNIKNRINSISTAKQDVFSVSWRSVEPRSSEKASSLDTLKNVVGAVGRL